MIYELIFLLIPFIYAYFYNLKLKKYPNYFETLKNEFGFKYFNYNSLIKASILAFILLFIYFLVNFVWSRYDLIAMNALKDAYVKSFKLYGFSFLLWIGFTAYIEELFFRALLTERFGILISSLLFAIFHNYFGSILYFTVAFIDGIFLAIFWKKYKDLNINFLGHLFYNAVILAIIL